MTTTRTALRALTTTAVAAASVLALAAPSAAAPPARYSYEHAFTSLATTDGETFLYVDGFDTADGPVGVVDVLGPLECTLPEDGTPLPFVQDGTIAASMSGRLLVDCWDGERGAAGEVDVDLTWTATGAPERQRLASPRSGCVGYVDVAPAVVTGTAALRVPDLGVALSAVVDGSRPADLSVHVEQCRQPGRP